MDTPWLVLFDVAALITLVGGIFLPRHRRADMVALLVGLNIGVMSVSIALSSVEIGAGLGLGLFGALAIVRMRSAPLELEHIAYAFSAIAIGLLAGFEADPSWLNPALMALVVVGMFIGDWPGMLRAERRVRVKLDRALADDDEVLQAARALVGRDIDEVVVKEIDLVQQVTYIDVRYRLGDERAAARSRGPISPRVGRRTVVDRSDFVDAGQDEPNDSDVAGSR